VTTPLTPVANVLPATVAIPSDGELVNSASVAGYIQPTLDAIAFAQGFVNAFINGGTLQPAALLLIQGPNTGTSISINAASFPHAGDGPVDLGLYGAKSSARVRAPKSVSQGSNAAGTHLFQLAFTDHVWNRSAVAVGCIWQIATASGLSPGECIRFVNFDTALLPIKDHTGATIVQLSFFTANIYAITMCWNGSTWDIIDESVLP
jgi:hypothetical protein